MNLAKMRKGVALFFAPFVQLAKWGVVAFIIFTAGAWLFVPTFRHNVKSIEGPGPQPTDCDFMTAPLGKKGCHYEMRRVLIDKDGNYIAAVDWFNSRTDGKRNDPNAKPETMVSSWEKVQE